MYHWQDFFCNISNQNRRVLKAGTEPTLNLDNIRILKAVSVDDKRRIICCMQKNKEERTQNE